jgi:hypothetical protein
MQNIQATRYMFRYPVALQTEVGDLVRDIVCILGTCSVGVIVDHRCVTIQTPERNLPISIHKRGYIVIM